jgi:CIC family chloride channel protein
MNVSFVETNHTISDSDASSLLTSMPLWIVVRQNKIPVALLLAADLSRYLSEHAEDISDTNEEEVEIDLLEIPAHREDVVPVNKQATLQQALESMNQKHVDAVYVTINGSAENPTVIGIITRQAVESQYHDFRNT